MTNLPSFPWERSHTNSLDRFLVAVPNTVQVPSATRSRVDLLEQTVSEWMTGLMKLEDVARIAGVSRSTVSRVINDDRRISDAVRKRVLDVIAKTHYHPNAAARSLVTRRTGNIGLIFPRLFSSMFSDPWSSQLIKGCLGGSELAELSLMLMLESTEDPVSMSRFFDRLVRERHLDGVVLASHHIEDALTELLPSGDFPYVLVGRDMGTRANFVDIDCRLAARTATNHMIEHGYRSIAVITGPRHLLTAKDRSDGFMDALEAAGLEPHSREPLSGEFAQRDGYYAARALLREQGRPEAIFAANDAMAIGAIQAARELGMRVLDDLAVVGFDDLEINTVFHTELTTIRQPTEEIGRHAVAMLAAMIAKAPPEPKQHWIDAELILRGSCGCPPARRSTGDKQGQGKEDGSFAAAAAHLIVQT